MSDKSAARWRTVFKVREDSAVVAKRAVLELLVRYHEALDLNYEGKSLTEVFHQFSEQIESEAKRRSSDRDRTDTWYFLVTAEPDLVTLRGVVKQYIESKVPALSDLRINGDLEFAKALRSIAKEEQRYAQTLIERLDKNDPTLINELARIDANIKEFMPNHRADGFL